MNPIATSLLALSAGLLLSLPRCWALLPLIAGACYMTGAVVELGVLTFYVLRILITIGFLRVMMRGERPAGGFNGLDYLMVLWAVWLCVSSLFHNEPKSDLIGKLGDIYDVCGFYFLVRIFCVSFTDIIRLCRATAIVLLPAAAAMLSEQIVGQNPFFLVGHPHKGAIVRDGRIRAVGPFRNPILAGTAGAVTLPLMIGLRHTHRSLAWMGGLACLSMVLCSSSSGPVMSIIAALLAVWFWRYRRRMQLFRWLSVVGYVVLDLVMNAPAYYVIMRLDVTGSSTGWHRARLIESSFAHLDEWWLAGTDYTRHWMPTGVSWSPDHADITNHYLKMGVLGGLPLMFIFIASLAMGFAYVGRAVRYKGPLSTKDRFVVWMLGSALFAAAVSGMSVSYFDQSKLFLYLPLAALGSVHSSVLGSFKASARRAPLSASNDPKQPLANTTHRFGEHHAEHLH